MLALSWVVTHFFFPSTLGDMCSYLHSTDVETKQGRVEVTWPGYTQQMSAKTRVKPEPLLEIVMLEYPSPYFNLTSELNARWCLSQDSHPLNLGLKKTI